MRDMIPTFGPLEYIQWVNIIKEYLPKVGIKYLMSEYSSVLFVAVINPYSVFKFLNILVCLLCTYST